MQGIVERKTWHHPNLTKIQKQKGSQMAKEELGNPYRKSLANVLGWVRRSMLVSCGSKGHCDGQCPQTTQPRPKIGHASLAEPEKGQAQQKRGTRHHASAAPTYQASVGRHSHDHHLSASGATYVSILAGWLSREEKTRGRKHKGPMTPLRLAANTSAKVLVVDGRAYTANVGRNNVPNGRKYM